MKLGLKEALDQHRKVRGNDDTPLKMYVRYCEFCSKLRHIGFWIAVGLTGLGLIVNAIDQPTTSDQKIQIQK